MKLMRCMGYGAVTALSLRLILLAPSTSLADRQVDAGTILLLSDEILGNSVEIERPQGTPIPAGGDVPGGAPPVAPLPTLADGGDGPGPVVPGNDDDSDSDSDHRFGNDRNRSGFADGSNPGLGSGNNNSGNLGTNNPSNADGNRFQHGHSSHR